VIVPLAEDRVIESDEAGLDDGSLAVMASMCEFLTSAVYRKKLL